ncbi:hypothetical protein [Nonomuraea insulae]|uniref:Immunity protein 35 domain-containing protein n=1 Tax=Nonomuraea insulae TaxID=1616787 RepID=A0ABW1CWE1_9ACTN
MSSIKERRRACEETLLAALRNQLVERDVSAVLLIEDSGRPGVEVLDVAGRTRRIYVHLQFRWFYWGDQSDERVFCLELPTAVARVQQAAQDGWRRGEQGELSFNLGALAEAYRF